VPVGIAEERHPFLDARVVAMDQVRCAGEDDSSTGERGAGGVDVIDTKVEDGLALLARALIDRAEEEPRALDVEERDVAIGLEVRELEDVAIPRDGRFDAAHAARHLPDGSQYGVGHGLLLFLRCGSEWTVDRNALPRSEFRSAVQAELVENVADVELHGVEAHSLAPANHAIGHAVAHCVGNPPLSRREHVGMRETSPTV